MLTPNLFTSLMDWWSCPIYHESLDPFIRYKVEANYHPSPKINIKPEGKQEKPWPWKTHLIYS